MSIFVLYHLALDAHYKSTWHITNINGGSHAHWPTRELARIYYPVWLFRSKHRSAPRVINTAAERQCTIRPHSSILWRNCNRITTRVNTLRPPRRQLLNLLLCSRKTQSSRKYSIAVTMNCSLSSPRSSNGQDSRHPKGKTSGWWFGPLRAGSFSGAATGHTFSIMHNLSMCNAKGYWRRYKPELLGMQHTHQAVGKIDGATSSHRCFSFSRRNNMATRYWYSSNLI